MKTPELSEEEQRRKNLENLMASSEDESKDVFDQRNADLQMYKNVFKSLNKVNN